MSADFFLPGHTYVREHHAATIRFLVRAVDQSPDGAYRVAFGWSVEDGDTTWSPFDSDDVTGWVDVTEPGSGLSPEFTADTARRVHLLHTITTQGGHWKTRAVARWYRAHGYVGLGVRAARNDLVVLRDSGALIQHDEKGVRYFTVARQGAPSA